MPPSEPRVRAEGRAIWRRSVHLGPDRTTEGDIPDGEVEGIPDGDITEIREIAARAAIYRSKRLAAVSTPQSMASEPAPKIIEPPAVKVEPPQKIVDAYKKPNLLVQDAQKRADEQKAIDKINSDEAERRKQISLNYLQQKGA
mgnify:CR=1 FL=1